MPELVSEEVVKRGSELYLVRLIREEQLITADAVDNDIKRLEDGLARLANLKKGLANLKKDLANSVSVSG